MVNTVDSSNPYDAYNNQQNGDLQKFTDRLLALKGKIVEFYIGDQCETINYNDYSVPKNCSIYGIITDVLDRFVAVDCFYVNKKGDLCSGNEVLINAFQIRMMTELNGRGSLADVFLDVKSADKVRKLLLSKK
jgi:hypothetical protein